MIRLSDYLTMALQAHGDILRELWFHARTHGMSQEMVMESLEQAQETQAETHTTETPVASASKRPAKPHSAIAHAVHAMNLPDWLEFYLWSYPYYRSWIESSTPLDAPINKVFSNSTDEVEAARHYGERWIRAILFDDHEGRRLEQSLQTFSMDRWLRFRTQALRAVGRRPLQSI